MAKKRYFLIITTLLIVVSIIFAMFAQHPLLAIRQVQSSEEHVTYTEQLGLYTAVKEDGSIEFIEVEADLTQNDNSFLPFSSAFFTVPKFYSKQSEEVLKRIQDIKYGVVNFKTKSVHNNTYFSDAITNKAGYMNGNYAPDGAFLGLNDDGSMVKFKQGDVVGWVRTSDVEVYDYNDEDMVKSVSYYYVQNGMIYHALTSDIHELSYPSKINVGMKQSYMNDGEYYYSYDGHYFYRTYEKMIDDYKNNTYANSINPNQPYYNYYQFLSLRSTSKLTASAFDTVVESIASSDSVLKNQGKHFFTAQNRYGANASLMMGVAINESAWGMSKIAREKNNIFGIAAYDSNPDNAYGFPSVEECIRQFAQTQVSIRYTDPKDVEGLYHGACLGDKSVGLNVKYASDPYWGEKAASHIYTILNKNKNYADLNSSTIGIKNTSDVLNVRKEPNTRSTVLYTTTIGNNYPFVILQRVQGESVYGNTLWYKIASDAPLSPDRNKTLQFMNNEGGEYDITHDYAYISAEYVDIVNNNEQISPPHTHYFEKRVDGKYIANNATCTSAAKYYKSCSCGYKSGEVFTYGSPLGHNYKNGICTRCNQKDPNYIPPKPSVKKGDVNNDGKVSAIDYLMIKDSILGKLKLNQQQSSAADVNKDGAVSSIDYLMLKDFILGKIKL